MEKLTTELVIYLFHLEHIKEKEYSSNKRKTNTDAYVFHCKDEYYNYFLANGVNLKNKELLDLAIFSELRNGDIIALKGLCDHIIDEVNKVTEYDMLSLELKDDDNVKIKRKNSIT